jgi:hypothetical protein
MQDRLETFSQGVNFTRYRGQPQGHYESFFVRANHPHRAQAFWIRYTIFNPKGRPNDAIGELWAIYFDAEQNRNVTAKQEYRLADCDFDVSSFRVRVGKATLWPNRLEGAIEGKQHSLAWDLKSRGLRRRFSCYLWRCTRAAFPRPRASSVCRWLASAAC